MGANWLPSALLRLPQFPTPKPLVKPTNPRLPQHGRVGSMVDVVVETVPTVVDDVEVDVGAGVGHDAGAPADFLLSSARSFLTGVPPNCAQ